LRAKKKKNMRERSKPVEDRGVLVAAEEESPELLVEDAGEKPTPRAKERSNPQARRPTPSSPTARKASHGAGSRRRLGVTWPRSVRQSLLPMLVPVPIPMSRKRVEGAQQVVVGEVVVVALEELGVGSTPQQPRVLPLPPLSSMRRVVEDVAIVEEAEEVLVQKVEEEAGLEELLQRAASRPLLQCPPLEHHSGGVRMPRVLRCR
jgi:hypothetical protein